MEKICLIRQWGGIGDIFFCQKIGYHFQNQGYKVIWPITKYYSYISNYINNFDYPIKDNSFPYKDIYENEGIREIVKEDNFIFIPLHLHNLRSRSVMHSKYNLVGLTFSDWDKYFCFKRIPEREDRLFYDILGLKDQEDYVLFNTTFACPPDIQEKVIDISKYNGRKIIRMKMHDNSHIFDWCKVLENASSIVSVDTSINYIIAKLAIKATDLQLYSRFTPANYTDIKGIFKTKWKYNI